MEAKLAFDEKIEHLKTALTTIFRCTDITQHDKVAIQAKQLKQQIQEAQENVKLFNRYKQLLHIFYALGVNVFLPLI